MSDLAETVMDILADGHEERTYAEFDTRFFAELEALHLSEADFDTAIGAWIATTDHIIEDRRALTEHETKLMNVVFERIIMRHGYFRIVKSWPTSR
jgi:hypothetical protein